MAMGQEVVYHPLRGDGHAVTIASTVPTLRPGDGASGRHLNAIAQEMAAGRATSGAMVTTSGTLIPWAPLRRQVARPSISPWTVYASPDATGDAAWRTVRVHSGTINGHHPQSAAADKYSDDTDYMEDGTTPNAADMDMVLDANSTYYICAVQTRFTTTGSTDRWGIDETYLFFSSDTDADFPGQGEFDDSGNPTSAEKPDVFRNAYYRTIAIITTGSDDIEADDGHDLLILPIVAENLTTDFVKPSRQWEAILTIDDANDPNGAATVTVQDGVDADHAGNILGPYGDKTQADSATQAYEYGTAAHAWLTVTVDVASGSLTDEIAFEDPSSDADPYNTNGDQTAVLVFPLFDIDAEALITPFQDGDISLQGIVIFADAEDTPKDITADESDNGTVPDVARADHTHKLDLTDTGFDGLAGTLTLTVLTGYSAGSYTFTTTDLTIVNGLITAYADGTPIVLSTTECSGT